MINQSVWSQYLEVGIGLFKRLFDTAFSLDEVRQAILSLTVSSADGLTLEGSSSMSQISRDPQDLVRQMMGPHHQYPDGAVLFLGTLFAPVKDRDTVGVSFTHKEGDIVCISSPHLGTLVNRMQRTGACAPWTFGVSHLMRNLAQRGLLT